ncbi:LuxR C-terminal-related transcriptional regulator [Stieleria varia]|uniref:Response regulator FixJ n=1 Tax=Stieleria varia TaxID=2528005 RepID=A0A5C6B6Z9_9BACT|nr:LuxR C-terminal-related transcriptional regulator [Stieleria varia]TWU07680.1 response regulator FixJ [Stieleria varia]
MESAIDLPRVLDFLEPCFFFAKRGLSQVTLVSPSVRDVLGYEPKQVIGGSYLDFVIHDDPINADLMECQTMDLSNGGRIQALRAVRAWDGSRRVLSIQTVGASDTEEKPVLTRHNVALDVTQSVDRYQKMSKRLTELTQCLGKMNASEHAIAYRLLDGKLNREIAKELNLSDRTVERRRASILKRLGTNSHAKVVQLMVERDLLTQMLEHNEPWHLARNANLVC